MNTITDQKNEDKPRELALYECNNCGKSRIKWSEKFIYRGVRDCCPKCICMGIVGTCNKMLGVIK